MQKFAGGIENWFTGVEDAREPLIVERRGENMVIMTEADYNGLMETLHQLSSPVNEQLLDAALLELRSGGGVTYIPECR